MRAVVDTRKYALPPEVLDLPTDLQRRAYLVKVDGSVHLCRDPKDDMFVETAQRGAADIL